MSSSFIFNKLVMWSFQMSWPQFWSIIIFSYRTELHSNHIIKLLHVNVIHINNTHFWHLKENYFLSLFLVSKWMLWMNYFFLVISSNNMNSSFKHFYLCQMQIYQNANAFLHSMMWGILKPFTISSVERTYEKSESFWPLVYIWNIFLYINMLKPSICACHTRQGKNDIYIRGSLNKFPDFFHMGTFIDSTHTKL